MNRSLIKMLCALLTAAFLLTGCKGVTKTQNSSSTDSGSSDSNSSEVSGSSDFSSGSFSSDILSSGIFSSGVLSGRSSSIFSSGTGSSRSGSSSTSASSLPLENKHNVKDITLNSKSVNKYELVEATFDFDRNYSNPFDPAEIDVQAIITTPKGQQLTVPCFVTKKMSDGLLTKWTSYYDKYAFIKPEEEVFAMRFSYNQAGTYKWVLTVSDKNGKSTVKGPDFEIKSGTASNTMWSHGPVEVSPDNKGYFRYQESKRDYVPVGYALPWSWPEDMANYRSNVNNLSSNGGNVTRIWGAGIAQTLELENKVTGVGKYQINHALIQDNLFKLMRENNVTVQYCFDSFTSLQSDPRWYGEWGNNPYNTKNGGFLSKSQDFFSNAKAKTYFKNRIRYSMARWGWDANITLLELWNEIDGVDNFHTNTSNVTKWIDEMCKYIRSLDIYKRPISISYANPAGNFGINNLQSIDYVTTHFYGETDMPAGMDRYIGNLSQDFYKPIIVGEFGPTAEDFSKGLNGIYMQEGIWSSIAVGSAMSAQSWWWEEVINKEGAYRRLASLRKFVDSFEFSKEPLTSLAVTTNNAKIKGYGQINNGNTRGFMWIQNKDNGWYEIYKNGRNGSLSAAIGGVTVTVPVKNGTYTVNHWNTWNASVAPTTETITAVNGKLTINVGSLQQDTAYSFVLK